MTFFLTCFFLIMYMIRPFEFVPAMHRIPIILMILGVSLITFFFSAIFGSIKLLKNGTDQMVIGVVIAMAFSHFRHGWIGGATLSFREFLPIFVGYFLVSHSVKSENQLKTILAILVACSSFLSVEAILQVRNGVSYFGVEPMNYQGEIRVMWLGPFSDPNDLGMAFVVVIPFLINSILRKKSVILTGIMFLNCYGIILTNSRGAILALISSIATYFVMRFRTFKGLLIGILFAVVIIVLGPSRMSQVSAGEESAHGRLDAWYAGYQMFKAYPMFGVGKGLFTDYHHLTAHNSYVLALAELGIFGSFFFAGVFYYPLLHSYRLFFKKTGRDIDPEAYHAYSAATGSLIGTMAAMFFLSRTYVLIPYLIAGLCNSILIIYGDKLTQSAEESFKPMAWSHMRNIFGYTFAGVIFIYLMVKVAI